MRENDPDAKSDDRTESPFERMSRFLAPNTNENLKTEGNELIELMEFKAVRSQQTITLEVAIRPKDRSKGVILSIATSVQSIDADEEKQVGLFCGNLVSCDGLLAKTDAIHLAVSTAFNRGPNVRGQVSGLIETPNGAAPFGFTKDFAV
jgi:hypothetical protein